MVGTWRDKKKLLSTKKARRSLTYDAKNAYSLRA